MPLPGGGGQSGAIRAGAAFVEIFVKPNYKGLDDIANRIGRFGKSLMKAGGIGIGLGAGLLAPITALFKGGLDIAGQLQDLQDEFGLTASGASKLGYAAKVAGAGLEDLEPILKGLAKQNTTGKPLDEFALDFADGLLAIDDGSERAAKAVETLGKGGLKFLRVAGDLKRLFGEAPLFNQETLDAADSFGQSLNKIKYTAMTALLPFALQAADAATFVAELVRKNQGLFQVLAAVGAGLIAAGTGLVGLGVAATAAAFAMKALLFTWGAIGAVLAFVVSPMGLVVATLAALAGLANKISGGGVIQFFQGLGETFVKLRTVFDETIGGISDALTNGHIELAGQIAMAGLNLAWQTGLNDLEEQWNKFTAKFSGGWGDVVKGFKLAWGDATDWLAKVMIDLMAWMARQMRTFVESLNRELGWVGRKLGFGDILTGSNTVEDINKKRDLLKQAIDAGGEKRRFDLTQFEPGQQPGAADRAEENAARQRLEELRNQARIAREAGADRIPGLLSQVAGATRGAFQIGSAIGQFGSGDSVGKQLVAQGDKQNNLLASIDENIQKIAPRFT